ncbi:type IV secretory system conjugative DNA transfer family protein [Kiloniella majae]|uniref:type IV secretory system conjugative DNA transfer family protein n=1 Tax=Kiloniella majae TaxID=1938558 RepID=UPI000A2770A7|nr:type IV secretory system conjugative DNA transfer family protein [Kiloniella majae]
MSQRDGKRMVIYGRSGSGKSHYGKKLIQGHDRIVCFDPEGEYGAERGFVSTSSLSELLEILKDCHEGAFKVAYVPSALREEAELHEVASLLERLQEPYLNGKSDLKVTLLVDELNLSFPLNPRPDYSGFARLCSRGRKRGINIIGITQRPAEVSTRFRGNIDRLACFALSVPNDFHVITQTIGPDAERAVRELPEYGHIFFENGEMTINGPT